MTNTTKLYIEMKDEERTREVVKEVSQKVVKTIHESKDYLIAKLKEGGKQALTDFKENNKTNIEILQEQFPEETELSLDILNSVAEYCEVTKTIEDVNEERAYRVEHINKFLTEYGLGVSEVEDIVGNSRQYIYKIVNFEEMKQAQEEGCDIQQVLSFLLYYGDLERLYKDTTILELDEGKRGLSLYFRRAVIDKLENNVIDRLKQAGEENYNKQVRVFQRMSDLGYSMNTISDIFDVNPQKVKDDIRDEGYDPRRQLVPGDILTNFMKLSDEEIQEMFPRVRRGISRELFFSTVEQSLNELKDDKSNE